MNILVTGGAGYIGTHTLIELMTSGHMPIVIDNFCNSSPVALDRVAEITGIRPTLYTGDVSDASLLTTIFGRENIDGVIHFAGLKAVGESVEKPLLYYRNNLDSTLALLEVMAQFQVRHFIFSSSATVYGSSPIPYRESNPAGQGIASPYGRTKYMIEQILHDTAAADPDNAFTILRYFNPIGAHPSGKIGDDPAGIPLNIMPYISRVAVGSLERLTINGDDYDTPDGTCRRDYIHVSDLARGHVIALEKSQPGIAIYNLGSGQSTSVLELIAAFEQASGRKVPYVFGPRRQGDLPEFYADVSLAQQMLGWQTTRTIQDMCRDSWNWQSHNPSGYAS